MSSTFRIGSIESVSSDARLLIEISQQAVSYVVIDNGNECVAVYSHYFAQGGGMDWAGNFLKQLVADENILHEDFKNTIIIYAHPQSVMVPSDLLQDAHKKEMLELVYGDTGDAFIRSDFLFRQYAHNVYPVPKQVDSIVSYLFSSPVTTHLYSLLPDMYQSPGNNLHCIFTPSSFTAMLVKEGKLQAIQSYTFKAAEDVAYYLLHLCEAYEMDVNETTLSLSGMIDRSSNLYAELYKYFLNIGFTALPEQFTYPGDIEKYPSHYFSHLLAAATCV